MAETRQLRISHVGLRGVVGPGMTAAHVLDFACAFATFLEQPGPVVIGRDPRASGVMIRHGVIASLLASGRDVIDLGVVSTPVIQHAIRRLGAAGGISIGASHNTAEWNALKFFESSGAYLSTAQAGELLDIYHLRHFSFVEWNRLGKLRHITTAIDDYLEILKEHFDFDLLKRFRVLVDCCNGTSSLILNRLNEQHGFRFILINEHLFEGRQFAHEPVTSRRTVKLQLAPLVRPVNAEAGFLFDVDSDRVAMATEEGEAVSSELILPVLADYLLPRQAGKIVITNLSSSALLDEVVRKHDGRVLRVPVGRQSTIDALSTFRPDQVALAGEGTGAVMMPQFRFIYDGIAAMLAILTFLNEQRARLSDLVHGYPPYFILKGQLPLSTRELPQLFERLQDRYEDGVANTTDGLRVDWPDRWFHVRVSQTEPVIRVIAEQRGAEPRELFESLMDEVRSFL